MKKFPDHCLIILIILLGGSCDVDILPMADVHTDPDKTASNRLEIDAIGEMTASAQSFNTGMIQSLQGDLHCSKTGCFKVSLNHFLSSEPNGRRSELCDGQFYMECSMVNFCTGTYSGRGSILKDLMTIKGDLTIENGMGRLRTDNGVFTIELTGPNPFSRPGKNKYQARISGYIAIIN